MWESMRMLMYAWGGSSRKELCRSWLQHPPLASIAVTLPVMTVSESLGLLHLVERRTSLAAHRHHRFNEQITRFPAEHNLFPPPVTRSKYTRKFNDWISPSQHHFFAYLSCWNLPLAPCHEILSSLHALLLENWKKMLITRFIVYECQLSSPSDHLNRQQIYKIFSTIFTP